MKVLIGLKRPFLAGALFLCATTAWSAPRMDSAVGTTSVIFSTVLPDHEDSNLYYVFPQSSEVLVKNNGVQDFLYVESRKYGHFGRFRVEAAALTIGLKPSLEADDLKLKMGEIRKMNPKARFSVVTAFKTEVVGSDSEGNPFFLGSNCPTVSGPLEVPVYCSVEVKPELSYGFRQIIKNTQTMVLHYGYYFYGMAGGKLNEYHMSVPLRVGSLDGSTYFYDQFGKSIE